MNDFVLLKWLRKYWIGVTLIGVYPLYWVQGTYLSTGTDFLVAGLFFVVVEVIFKFCKIDNYLKEKERVVGVKQ